MRNKKTKMSKVVTGAPNIIFTIIFLNTLEYDKKKMGGGTIFLICED